MRSEALNGFLRERHAETVRGVELARVAQNGDAVAGLGRPGRRHRQ